MGDRKHYYEYQGGPEQFLVDILKRRTDIPDIDLEMIYTIQKKAEIKVKEHFSYCRLWNYLEELQLYLKVMHSVRKKNLGKFEMVLQSGSFDDLNLPEASALNSGEIADFLNNLMTSEDPSKIGHEPISSKLPLPYIELKREYFRGIKTGLNPLYAQSVANLLIIVHDVIIEKATTQEAIQESTQLPRSTISNVLSLAVDEGVIEVEKFPGSRTKVYRPAISLTELILSYYNRAFAYASDTREKIVDVLNGMQDITLKDSAFMVFLEKLNVLKRAYTITEEFTIRAKAEFIKELMSEHGGRT
jgi:DNA-binding transcriptional regulator GbsR (MarR family)